MSISPQRPVIRYYQARADERCVGWTDEEVEQQVVALIQSGAIQARVDSQNKGGSDGKDKGVYAWITAKRIDCTT
ncbi:hypothetical protein K443DRAFT_12154 [Laccaria amethystina LaAM-08-1]|uniref:Uncharacterized protein n=1 Tax=Laccaria amethystina LaAM-08-1 TaxID=1095629 RepID=A0A0C9WS25_9AGAR|nr:hypothetical protein K443DRAFT_12154 [Laccaria amethystina LaAM-08-1]